VIEGLDSYFDGSDATSKFTTRISKALHCWRRSSWEQLPRSGSGSNRQPESPHPG
jgi:hypothetical protein